MFFVLWDVGMLHEELTGKILAGAFQVANVLGSGFLEKVYENALAHELRKAGFSVQQQKGIPVYYDGVVVGDYVADLIVENAVIVELKAIANFEKIHTAQCINYLKATHIQVCMLLNFGKPRLDYKRIVNEIAFNS